MSSLDKLAIRGIRSFDHNEISVVQFFNPLTVIVGHNGSGKTTIIECLKYATTGDMPPNTKGGAFVHDPSIAGTSEVKAQVKLRFFNSRNQKMLVERRLQVTKKKGGTGLTMKTLEGTISLVDDERDKKQRTSLSTKCAELDEEVPKQLGVSRAILDNVIFCHQEESNWPLSEPAALKKKFDEIFEATKYTKALDQIKILRRDQAVEIKVDKEKLLALKTDRDRAHKLRRTTETLSASIDVKEADHAELETKIKKTVAENVHFFNQASKHQDIVTKAQTIKTQRELVEENLAQVRANLQELSDTDQELAKKIETHESDLEAAKAERSQLVRSMEDEQDAQSKFEKKRSEAQTSHGRLLAEKQRYLDNLCSRQTLIQEIATRHSIAGYDHDLNEAEMAEFEQKLEDAIDEQNKKIQTMKAEARQSDREREQIISAMKIAKASDERSKANMTDQIRATNNRIRAINSKLDNATTSIADITIGESALADEKRRKKELEDAIKAASYPNQLREKASENRGYEEKREQLHSELTSLNLQADVRAKLGLKSTEKGRKDEAIQSLLDKSAATFRRYAKSDPTRTKMEAEVTAVVKILTQDINGAERTLKDATRDLSAVETSVNLTKSKLKELTESAAAQKKKISDGLKGLDTDAKSIEGAIKEAEDELVLARDAVKQKQGFVDFYRMLAVKGKKDKVCMGCDRSLDKKELVEFERFCKSQEERAPQALKDAQADLAGWETQIVAARRLLPAEVAYAKLMNEDIPAAEKAAEAHSSRLPSATTKAQEAGTRVAELKAQLEELQLLKKTAGDVMRMHRECEDITRDISKLESELSASGSTATSDDIQAELSQLADKIRAVTSSMEKLRTESQKQASTLQTMGDAVHSAELRLNKKQQEFKEKEALEAQKAAMQTEVEQLDTQTRELEKKIRESDAPLRKAEDEATEARRQFGANEAVANRELSGFNKSSEQLDINQREIKAYVTRGGDAQLAKCERDLKQHEKAVEEKKAQVAQLQINITKIDKAHSDSVAVLRNYKDNVQLRDGRRKIRAYTEEIDALDAESAEKAYRKFDAEYNAMRKRQSDLQAHQAKLGGEIETMKKDLDDKRGELKSEYDNIDEKYKTELIKVKTAEVANSDLEKYGKALDSAIMSFHGHKMAEINDTISDLWTKTYQGTDIDKIMIKSDSEGKVTAGGRSYNYRVVMQKDNTEMDMRGRCSAGQKVLASIIIRLALAESFGTNCGIMALDEPTTNLDHDNIQALASALAELIKERKGQANFQLIVITHDEHFLETLGSNGVLDKYWRVSRGDGGQVSTIEKQRLN